MKKLRVAIIGCGRISIMHLIPAKNLPQSELVACCDIDLTKAKNTGEKFSINYYQDYKQMIEKENLDVVHICLPHYLHTVVAEYCFKCGINVFSEKPMSINYESSIHCVEEAKKYNVLYGVVFQCRYDNSTQIVKKRIVDGTLGKILFAKSYLTWRRDEDYYKSSDWKGTWDKEGGGVIIDQAIHSIDIVNYLIDDDYDFIKSSLSNFNHNYLEVEDTAVGFVKYKEGAQYTFYAMNNYGEDSEIIIELICEHGKVKMSYEWATISYNNGSIEDVKQENEVELYEGAKSYWGIQHIKQIKQFYNSVLGIEKLEISGENALKTHKLIFEIYKEGLKTL